MNINNLFLPGTLLTKLANSPQQIEQIIANNPNLFKAAVTNQQTNIGNFLLVLANNLNVITQTKQSLLNLLPPELSQHIPDLFTFSLADEQTFPAVISTAAKLNNQVLEQLQTSLKLFDDAAKFSSNLPQTDLTNLRDLLAILDSKTATGDEKNFSALLLTDIDQLFGQLIANTADRQTVAQFLNRFWNNISPYNFEQQLSPAAFRQFITIYNQYANPATIPDLSNELPNEHYNLYRQIRAMVKVREMLLISGLPAEKLSTVHKMLNNLRQIIQTPFPEDNDINPDENTTQLALPLYISDGSTTYPAYLHIFHQQEKEAGSFGFTKPETWLRICILTQNLGLVNIVFHLYEGNNLSVNIEIPAENAVNLTNGKQAELSANIADSSFNLTSLKLSQVGKR